VSIFTKTRLAAVGTLGIAALALSACAAAPETPASTTGSGPAASDYLACMVSDEGGFDDKSFNELAYQGLVQAKEQLGVQTKQAESKSPDEYQSNIDTMVQQGCNIIIPVGFKLADATKAAAAANQETDFAIVDVSGIETSNLLTLNYDTAQAAFLAGYAAAAYSKTGVVGTYGGASIPSVTIFMDGFANGVKHYNEAKGKNVQVLGWDVASQTGSFVGDFTNQVAAQQITAGFLSQNADVVLPVGGPLYQGGAEAIKAAGSSAVILGVDSDLAKADPKYADMILVSIMKGLDVSVLEAIKEGQSGAFKGGTYVGTLENKGVSLSGFGAFESQLPAGTTQELEQLKADVIAGKYPTLSPSSPKTA